MLSQVAGSAIKKTFKAFKDEAKELDKDGLDRYNTFKEIADQFASADAGSESAGSKLLIAYIEENLNTPAIQFELAIIGKYLQDTVPIATHSLSGALSQDSKQWTELAEKIMDWFTAKIMSTDSAPVIAQISLDVGTAVTTIVKVKDRSETADMIASAIHLLFAINKKSKQAQKKILKELPSETLGAIFAGSEDPICRYQSLALFTMCLSNIEDPSKNKQEHRKALDAFTGQIDPSSGSVDRLRTAIALCKPGEGLQESRIVDAMNHFDDSSGTQVYLANEISVNKQVMLGGAPIAIFIQKDHIYWNGEDLEVCANCEGEETIRTFARNIWRVSALTVTIARKSLSIRAVAARIDSVSLPVTIRLEAADLDRMEERLREGKATIVQAAASVPKQKASKAKESVELFGKAPNRGGKAQNGDVEEQSQGGPVPVSEPNPAPTLTFRPEQEVAALVNAAENPSDGEDHVESAAPEPQQIRPRASEPVPGRQRRVRVQKQDASKESMKAAKRPVVRPVRQAANGTTRTTRSSAPQEDQANRVSSTETPEQADQTEDDRERVSESANGIQIPPEVPERHIQDSGSRSRVPPDLQARGNSPDFRPSPSKSVVKTYGKKAQKSPKSRPAPAGSDVKRTPPQAGQTTSNFNSKQKSTPSAAQLRQRAKQSNKNPVVQPAVVETFQAEACLSSTPKINVQRGSEAPLGPAVSPEDQEISNESSEEDNMGNSNAGSGFDDVFTDHNVNAQAPRAAVEDKSPAWSLPSKAKPAQAQNISEKATLNRTSPPVRPIPQNRKAMIAPVLPAPSQPIQAVDQETPSRKPAAPPKVKSLSRLIDDSATPARLLPRLRPQTTLVAVSTEIESDEEEQAIESLNQQSILADIEKRKKQAKRKKGPENPLSESDDLNHPIQDDDATFIEPVRKKQKVTEGLMPFLVDENDAFSNVRNLMSRINQTVWDDFSAQSAEAPIQAKRCQEDLIADTDESVRDYASQCLDIYEIWYEGDQQRRSIEHQLLQDINASHRNATNVLKRTRTKIAGLATSKTGLRTALFA